MLQLETKQNAMGEKKKKKGRGFLILQGKQY